MRRSLPADVKVKMTGLLASLPYLNPKCAYGVLMGEALGVQPITRKAYDSVIAA